MKKFTLTFLFAFVCSIGFAQKSKIDSLLMKIDQTEDIKELQLVTGELTSTPEGAFALLKKGKQDLQKAEKAGLAKKQQVALILICDAAFQLHDAPELLTDALKGIRICHDTNDAAFLHHFFHFAGLANIYDRNFHRAVNYFSLSTMASLASKDIESALGTYSDMESCYANLNMPDSALIIARREFALLKQLGGRDKPGYHNMAMADLAEALAAKGNIDSALYYDRVVYEQEKKRLPQVSEFPYLENNIAIMYLRSGKPDSAAKYALDAYSRASKTRNWEFTATAASILAKAYEGSDDKKSLFYLKAQITSNDSITASDKARQFELVAGKEKQYQEELKAKQEQYNTRIRFYIVIAVAAALLIIGFILWRNNRKQKQSNLLLSEQKEEIEAQRDNLGHTLDKLQATQTQLIQAEKMASLGELTAGIAHEIQNPLNFVNNFSEVSVELLTELKEEEEKGNKEDVMAIADDLTQNLEKILHHGKRADAIVKGMLQHSQSGSGTKEPTNINALTDECMRLAYHGLRAKDKGFNAEMISHLDEMLPKINVIQQDIGRVMLNLFNNAFYAVNQKQKTAVADYKPAVSVTTSVENGQVTIKVKDNGIGIPDSIKEKIMQPFFTTKPTGEGTGLGLSLTYDMVVKGHGGSIQIDSKEGEGSEFIISLPR